MQCTRNARAGHTQPPRSAKAVHMQCTCRVCMHAVCAHTERRHPESADAVVAQRELGQRIARAHEVGGVPRCLVAQPHLAQHSTRRLHSECAVRVAHAAYRACSVHAASLIVVHMCMYAGITSSKTSEEHQLCPTACSSASTPCSPRSSYAWEHTRGVSKHSIVPCTTYMPSILTTPRSHSARAASKGLRATQLRARVRPRLPAGSCAARASPPRRLPAIQANARQIPRHPRPDGSH